MDHLPDILRFMSLGCQLLLVVHLLSSSIVMRQRIPTSAFIVCIMCYLLADWAPMENYSIFYFVLGPTFCLTFMFWLFSLALFDDSFRLKSWMIWVVLAIVAFRYVIYFFKTGNSATLSSASYTVGGIIEYSLSLVFVALGIAVATRNRKDDLITIRYEFRNIFVFLSAILIVLTILCEITYQQQDAPGWLEFVQKLFAAVLTFYFAIKSLKLKSGFFVEETKDENELIIVEPNEQLVKKLSEQMDVYKSWLTEGLTIRQLAEKIEVKEYLLRKAINQHLGFRNFNDYLNSYRIQEACTILKDPEKRKTTILEIAYQLGYNSLSPFNKAFKRIVGMTPTEFRRTHQK